MDYIIRELAVSEYPLLRDFLYEAIFIPEGVTPPARDILDTPELQVYLTDFGTRDGDIAFVAEHSQQIAGGVCGLQQKQIVGGVCGLQQKQIVGGVCGLQQKQIVGAVWVRIMNDYGHIDENTPSFAISLYKEYRNYGIGTALMQTMLQELKRRQYKQASLAVQKENYAVGMYQKVGFKIIDENEQEYIMLCKLK